MASNSVTNTSSTSYSLNRIINNNKPDQLDPIETSTKWMATLKRKKFTSSGQKKIGLQMIWILINQQDNFIFFFINIKNIMNLNWIYCFKYTTLSTTETYIWPIWNGFDFEAVAVDYAFPDNKWDRRS